jgi:hypothetical protein
MCCCRVGRCCACMSTLGLAVLNAVNSCCFAEEGVAKIGDVGMVRPHVADLVTAQPLMTPLWAAPEVLRRERAGVKVGCSLLLAIGVGGTG